MIHVEKFVPGGQSLGTLSDPSSLNNGKKVFLWNALPGETVEEFKLLKQKSSYLEAVATKIKNPSKDRLSPKDACFLSTSPWQILNFSRELEEKRLLVEESLKEAKIPLENLEIEPVATDGKDFFYRNKMEYSLYWDNDLEKIFLSFHARGSHRKIPLYKKSPSPSNLTESLLSPFSPETAGSSLERPEIAERALKIVEELNNAHASARDYQSLLLRANQQGVVSGGLFKNNQPHPVFPNLTDKILGVEYSYSPNGFFQINLPVYELALKEIKQIIDASSCKNVLDLYSGVGTIGLSVARDRNLTLVEVDKDAYRELTNNCKKASANPVLSKSEEALDFIQPDQIVILDPPRAGCDKKLLDRLLEVLPEKIIYLSCNPSTQARDIAALLSNKNYKLTKIAPFNFFPRTPHIENLIVLEKR
ncbi:class I SAM-dependent RNA methyltransferase [Candidatus Saccharibacteria bacterium]|nr:class I SAM-dependent RNA methyltransferase [Candidatus Saccharibacteria bacterium]